VEERTVINGVDFTEKMPTGEVAKLFDVDPRTITDWADKGYLACIRLPSGHRRFSRAQVEALLRDGMLNVSGPGEQR
jgi:excisionase family DNA binding protein